MDSRLPKLFLLICKEQIKIEIKELANELQISTRTVYNDIKKLNELLLSNGYEEIVIEKGKVSFQHLGPESFQDLINLEDDYYLIQPRIRRLRLLTEVLLFPESFTVDELLLKIPVSRNTILSDLKWVKEELNFHQIEIVSRPFTGYKITGDEQSIRNLLTLSVLEDPLFFENSQVDTRVLNKVADIIENCADVLEVTLSDSSYDRLKIIFWVTLNRISNGKKIEIFEDNTKEEKIFTQQGEHLEQVLGVTLEKNELIYLSQKFMESSMIQYSRDITDKWMNFNLLTGSLVKTVTELSDISFFLNDELLFEGILNHLRPAYHRVTSQTQVKNPMYDFVQRSFYNLNQNVTEGIQLIEKKLKVKFSKDEISFFTLFFIASIERRKDAPDKPQKIIIVCDSGVSTSQIVRSKLEVNFEVEILGVFGKRTVAEWLSNNEVELIISTIHYENDKIPVVQVTPFVTEDDMDKLFSKLNTKREKVEIEELMTVINENTSLTYQENQKIKKGLMNYFKIKESKKQYKGVYQPMLIEILHEGLIHVNFPAKTRDEAVRASGQLLVDNGLAKASYIEGMIENVEVNGTYIVIAPGIAMPHARPETGAIDIGLSILTLADPVVFGHPKNDPVNIVIGLCAIDHQSHLKALSELVEILSDQEKINQINAAETNHEILEIIKGGI